MGGSAFIIKGSLDESKIQHFEEPNSILDRMVRKRAVKWPKINESKDGSKSIELYTKDVQKELSTNFITFLKQLKSSWKATTSLIENYLSSNRLCLYLRGEQRSAQSGVEWYIQFSFSGSAGFAEISAEVSSHFVEIWYKLNKDEIDYTLLTKLGFTPSYVETTKEPPLYYFPLDYIGYIAYEENTFYLDEGKMACHFAIDDGWVESIVDDTINVELIFKIESLITKYFSEQKRCYCQLCFPEFVPPELEA